MPMATYKPHNSVPRIWYPGLKDESTRAQSYEIPSVPAHAPLFFGYAPKGPKEAMFGYLGTLEETFGEITNEKSKFGTLATPFLKLAQKEGQPIFFQRLIPADAGPEATLCLALEVVETDKYRERVINLGAREFERDRNNLPAYTGVESRGIVARWKVIPLNDGQLGQRGVEEGAPFYENDNTNRSRVYPIIEFKASYIGSYANNIGLRFESVRYSEDKNLENLVKSQRARTFNIFLMKRRNAYSTPYEVPTLADERGVSVCFKPGSFNPYAGNKSIDIEDVFLEAWEDIDPYGNRPSKYGELGEIHVYRENLAEVLNKMAEVEFPINENEFLGMDPDEDRYMIDFFTGRGKSGIPYKRVEILDELNGSGELSLAGGAVHYLTGGSDGTMSNEKFDLLCRQQFEQFGQLESKFLDMGKYPLRQVYDIGYAFDTKLEMIKLLGKRQDVNITMTPLDLIISDKIPDMSTQESQGNVLLAKMRSYPESEQWGTPTYRGVIVPSAMRIIDNPAYKKYVPSTYQVMAWRIGFMNSPDGFIPGRGYDQPPYNHVTAGYKVTDPYISATNFERLWATGMTHFIHKTDRLLFCPGLRTVYKDDTSVLTSDIFMQMTCDVNYISFQVWTDLTGNSKLSDEDLIATSNEKLSSKLRGRYDNRYIIVPTTYLDKQDQENGYSWSCKFDVYAPNMRTVLKSFIVAHRLGDL